LLFDCGFDDLEAMRWLFTADDSLPGTPIDGDRQAPQHGSQPARTGARVLSQSG
jgi:hypothetical protein